MRWAMIAACTLLFVYILYLARLAWLAFGGSTKASPTAASERPVKLTSILAFKDLDCEFAMLWETQLPLLRILRATGDRGLPTESMSDPYGELARSYPELCDGSRLNDWVQAMKDAEIIDEVDHRVELTEKGYFVLEFLEYQAVNPCQEVALLQEHSGHL